jgi:hypothetical protein
VPRPDAERIRGELAEIAERVSRLPRVLGEGLERELRAEVRDWLISSGWAASEMFVGERIDVRLWDGLGLPAVYIETKDPIVGISDAEIDKAFDRATELPRLRAIV